MWLYSSARGTCTSRDRADEPSRATDRERSQLTLSLTLSRGQSESR